MKKIYATLLAVIAATTLSFARTFDGTEKIYLKAAELIEISSFESL